MGFVFIKSYAHAESLGIKPVDAIVDAVISDKDKSPPYVLRGFSRGHTISGDGTASFSSRLKTYVVVFDEPDEGDDFEYTISAESPQIARMVAKEKYKPNTYKLLERKTSYKEIR